MAIPHIVAIAKSVSALDFNFERAVGGLILTAGEKVESEKSECNNGLFTNWSNLVAVTDWVGANLGLVSVGGSTIIRSNGIETICHLKNPSNDVKDMQSVLPPISHT